MNRHFMAGAGSSKAVINSLVRKILVTDVERVTERLLRKQNHLHGSEFEENAAFPLVVKELSEIEYV